MFGRVAYVSAIFVLYALVRPEPSLATAIGAVAVAVAFAERTIRVAGFTAKALHVGLALSAGGVAGSVLFTYSAASPAVLLLTLVVVAVASGAPFVVEADDSLAAALTRASRAVASPARETLLRAANLRRSSLLVPVPSERISDIDRSWRTLDELASSRVELARSTRTDHEKGAPGARVAAQVDDRIARELEALMRAYGVDDALVTGPYRNCAAPDTTLPSATVPGSVSSTT